MNILEPENNDFHQVRIMEAAPTEPSVGGPINWKITALGLSIALLALLTENLVFIKPAAQAQSGRDFSGATPKVSNVNTITNHEGSPIYGVKIPAGYRQWELIAPSREAGDLGELRVILGNMAAMKAFQIGSVPFPDGTMIAKLAWKQVPSNEDNNALGQMQAFVPGHATTVQFMVKDSRKYASTGGWGFGRFINGKPVDEAQHDTCFPCHKAYAKEHDLVFTKLAP
jgi:hypothetical protein